MNMHPLRTAPLLIFLLAAGCQRDSQPANAQPTQEQAGSEAPQQAPATATAAEVQLPGKRVGIPAGKGKKEKQVLQPGQELSGSFASPEAGTILGIAVKIGTYSNRPPADRSDGVMTLKACLRESCSTGAANLASANDNAFLDFNLDNPIQAAAGEAITYTVRKDSGTNSIVIWTFPLQTGQTGLVDADGVETGKTPRVSLRYSKD